jgi:hypothetical protein
MRTSGQWRAVVATWTAAMLIVRLVRASSKLWLLRVRVASLHNRNYLTVSVWFIEHRNTTHSVLAEVHILVGRAVRDSFQSSSSAVVAGPVEILGVSSSERPYQGSDIRLILGEVAVRAEGMHEPDRASTSASAVRMEHEES